MNCKTCGSPLTENDQFCKTCGAAVNAQNAPTVPPDMESKIPGEDLPFNQGAPKGMESTLRLSFTREI